MKKDFMFDNCGCNEYYYDECCNCCDKKDDKKDKKEKCIAFILCEQAKVSHCEAHLFCEVTQRMICELQKARSLSELNYVMNMINCFLMASADKEKSLAEIIEASKHHKKLIKHDCCTDK